jgi:hypothetical protein
MIRLRHSNPDRNKDNFYSAHYIGERITTRGDKQITPLAANALRFFTTEKPPLPIFEDIEGISMEYGYSQLSKKYIEMKTMGYLYMMINGIYF